MGELKTNSILADIKDYLGLNPEDIDEDFNSQIISCINTSISELAQLGLGRLGAFNVENGSETWADFLGENYTYVFAFARNYIEVNTKLLWDPPQGGALKAALDEQLKKATFNVMTAIELHDIEEAEND